MDLVTRSRRALALWSLVTWLPACGAESSGDATPYVGNWKFAEGEMLHDCAPQQPAPGMEPARGTNSFLLNDVGFAFTSPGAGRLSSKFFTCPLELVVLEDQAELDGAQRCEPFTLQRTTMTGTFDRFTLLPSGDEMLLWAHATAEIRVDLTSYRCTDVVVRGALERVTLTAGGASEP
jgi:hypothetical protein